MNESDSFRIIVVDLNSGMGKVVRFGQKSQLIGGSGLAAGIFEAYANSDLPPEDPAQPLIFAIGPLTGFFPLMSKVVCAFVSPYHGQYAESHAGGRMALAMRFAHLDALVLMGRAKRLSILNVGIRHLEMKEVELLRGLDVFHVGKLLRKVVPSGPGQRSILRIGPAGERGVKYACINVDTYRHFGRLGGGAVMGNKNLKAIIIEGQSGFPAPENKEYSKLYKDIFEKLTKSGLMKKYHDLGTAENLAPLDALNALPWNNLQKTSRPELIDGVTGERFAQDLLLRQAACSGCPVGCIHIGLLREMFAKDNDYLYRQVSYDYEPIFSCGTMLGLGNGSEILGIMDEVERQGLDVMSAGVALAWAAEALEKGIITENETLLPLKFGDAKVFREAMKLLGSRANEFYHLLGQGTMAAAQKYGGEDFACVLGQEMAGYATGEVFFVSQALGLRHSHLDSGGYSVDQKLKEKDPVKVVSDLVEDERKRVMLTSMVSCLFARAAYTEEVLGEILTAVGYNELAGNLETASKYVQCLRWKMRAKFGFVPDKVKIPKRYTEITTWKGPLDANFMEDIRAKYVLEVQKMIDWSHLK